MSLAFHTVTRSLILMGLGYVPFLIFLYQVDLHTGMMGSMGGMALGLPRIVLKRKYFSGLVDIGLSRFNDSEGSANHLNTPAITGATLRAWIKYISI